MRSQWILDVSRPNAEIAAAPMISSQCSATDSIARPSQSSLSASAGMPNISVTAHARAQPSTWTIAPGAASRWATSAATAWPLVIRASPRDRAEPVDDPDHFQAGQEVARPAAGRAASRCSAVRSPSRPTQCRSEAGPALPAPASLPIK